MASQVTHILLRHTWSTIRCRHCTLSGARVLTWPRILPMVLCHQQYAVPTFAKVEPRTNMQNCTSNCIELVTQFHNSNQPTDRMTVYRRRKYPLRCTLRTVSRANGSASKPLYVAYSFATFQTMISVTLLTDDVTWCSNLPTLDFCVW